MNFSDDVVEVPVSEGEQAIWLSQSATRDDGLIHLTRWTGAVVTARTA